MKKKIIIVFLSLLPVILLASLVFFFSSQTSTESSETSGRIVNFVIKIIKPGYESLSDQEKTNYLNKLSTAIRSLAHFTEFMFLGIFTYIHILIVEAIKNKKIKFGFLIALSFTIFYAFTDELHQSFVPGRAMQLLDILIDSLGAFLGTSIIYLKFKYLDNKKEEQPSSSISN